MIQNPEVLSKSQKELDQICGTRMPTARDLQILPYLRAVMSETLRWRPVAPGGIPHKLVQDDVYKGYLLPTGTMLFANTWSIHQDDEDYEEGSKFRPDRWLENASTGTRSGSAETDTSNGRRATYTFGAGRRVCPGQGMAENSLVRPELSWQ